MRSTDDQQSHVCHDFRHTAAKYILTNDTLIDSEYRGYRKNKMAGSALGHKNEYWAKSGKSGFSTGSSHKSGAPTADDIISTRYVGIDDRPVYSRQVIFFGRLSTEFP